MNENRRPTRSINKLMGFMMLWITISFGFAFLQGQVLVWMFGADVAENAMKDVEFIREHRHLLGALQMGYTLIVFLVPAIVFALLQKKNILRSYSLNRVPHLTVLMLGVGAIVCSIPFILTTHELNAKLPLPGSLVTDEAQLEGMLKALLEMNNYGELAFNLLMMAVLPALAEEVFFRGGMQRLMRQATGNADIAIIMTALTFSTVHMQFSGFIPRLVLGMLFGYMFYWSRNLWVPIVCHMIYNGYQIVLYFFYTKDGAVPDATELGAEDNIPAWASLISVLLMFLILRQFYTRTVLRKEIRL